jgi:hypothetical protein
MPLYSLGHVIVQHLHNGDVCTVQIDESKPLAILYARVALAVRVVLLPVHQSQVSGAEPVSCGWRNMYGDPLRMGVKESVFEGVSQRCAFLL